MRADGPSVLVWKATWLPGSETFVRNQVDALERWRPSCVGIKHISSPLARDTDQVLYGETPAEKLRRRAFLHRRASARLGDMVAETQPHLVHAHFGSDATLIAPEAQRSRLPLIVTAHGADVLSPHAHAPSVRRRIADVLRRADRVVAVSSFLASRVHALGVDPEKIVVHYTGIPVDDKPRAGHEARWDISFVGRLVDRKGVGDALAAARTAQDRVGRSLRVCIMGDGPLREAVEHQARSLDLDVHMTGYLSNTRVHDELARSRVFLAPSRTGPRGEAEAFGMVFLEAASQEVPVVAYRHGGVVEAVANGESGLLVEEGDVAALGGAVADLLLDESRRRALGTRGRVRVQRDFDVLRQTRGLEEIYDSVVGS